MSILIKGIDMPKYSYHEIKVWDDGSIEITQPNDSWKRIPNAVIHIPSPHGRLIDIGEYKKEGAMQDGVCYMCPNFEQCEKYTYTKMEICEWLDDAPTILEAEE